ncbi:hypothetical protein [Pseudarthrobacter sp. PH31-O2]|uniref:hypothetical protein n=1 Tax=Pseudarthrobacter sp. PH31-O2 TaxID=3046206 RepID=UPI0024BB5CAF|nr:hypothetical protein [Pseudarthrobacter sp. PH31-O2]MDJ0351345.1 hypothetical protein [Pseudarthrobacter sp. PH31-O2]
MAAIIHLVPYEHPRQGYGYSSGSHADLYKNPNRHAPHTIHLFDKALLQIAPIDSHRLIGIGLDDDDIWQPWQVVKMARAASAAYEQFPSEKLFVLGLQNSYLCYVGEQIEVDDVRLKRILTGNKFIVGSTAELETLRFCSPWSIPEVFNENSQDRMRRVGLRMLETSENRPGWVYMRWGDNYTQARKDSYYEEFFGTQKLTDIHEVLVLNQSTKDSDVKLSFRIRPREFEVRASRDAHGAKNVLTNFSSMAKHESLSYSVTLTNGIEAYATITGCEADAVSIDGVHETGIFAKAVLFRDAKAISTTRSRGLI